MRVDDYLDMVATLTNDQGKPLAWEKGGRGVVRGWVEMMKRAHETRASHGK